jgi:hypothetical protein
VLDGVAMAMTLTNTFIMVDVVTPASKFRIADIRNRPATVSMTIILTMTMMLTLAITASRASTILVVAFLLKALK